MTILLAHDPRRLTEAAALGVPLVLSGHTHGGQVVLPVVGAVAAQKFPVVAGIGRRDRTTMFVSRGVGTIYVPVRINCPPEVALLTLQSENLPRNADPAARIAGHQRPIVLKHHPDRFGIDPVLLDQNARRQRLDGVVVSNRHGGLQHDRTAVELRRDQVDGRARSSARRAPAPAAAHRDPGKAGRSDG